jgi:Cof subfamily protein (haloacid dehalogenase superfamily)
MLKEVQPAFDLIAIDCDDTILDSDKNLSSGIHAAVDEARSRGVKITLISGRNLASMQFIIDELGITEPIIGGGGSFIYDVQSNKLIEEHPLPLPATRALVHLCREEEVVLVLEYVHCAMQEKNIQWRKRSHSNHGYQRQIVPDLLQELNEAPVKAMVVGQGQALQVVYDGILQRKLFDSLSFSSKFSIDIVPSGVNKGSGLRALAEYEHIPLQHIAVIGDWMNDLDMFRISGFSVAMGNAPQEVKAAANLVAPGNDHGGAAWAIHQILQKKRQST